MISLFGCVRKRTEKYACLYIELRCLSLSLSVYQCLLFATVVCVQCNRQSAMRRRDACRWKRELKSKNKHGIHLRECKNYESWACQRRNAWMILFHANSILQGPFNWNCDLTTEVQNLLVEVGLDSCQHVKAGLWSRESWVAEYCWVAADNEVLAAIGCRKAL